VGTLAVLALVGLVAGGLVASLGAPRPMRYRLAEALMIAGTLPWLYLILSSGHQPRKIYWLPGTDLRDQFRVGLHFAAQQIGGNLLVFAAFGAGAPVRWRLRPAGVVAIAAAASAVLELTQWFFVTGRVTSIDDVLVNALGAGVFTLLSRRWWQARQPLSTRVDNSGTTVSPDAGTVSGR
jgi:VanZ family protein